LLYISRTNRRLARLFDHFFNRDRPGRQGYDRAVRIGTTSRRLPRLSTQLLLLQLAIIVLTVGVSSVVVYLHSRDDIAKRAGAESLAIAQTVATNRQVVAALTQPNSARIIDPIAERIRRATAASFVVVARITLAPSA